MVGWVGGWRGGGEGGGGGGRGFGHTLEAFKYFQNTCKGGQGWGGGRGGGENGGKGGRWGGGVGAVRAVGAVGRGFGHTLEAFKTSKTLARAASEVGPAGGWRGGGGGGEGGGGWGTHWKPLDTSNCVRVLFCVLRQTCTFFACASTFFFGCFWVCVVRFFRAFNTTDGIP